MFLVWLYSPSVNSRSSSFMVCCFSFYVTRSMPVFANLVAVFPSIDKFYDNCFYYWMPYQEGKS